MKGYLHILYSEKLDKYYIGSTNDLLRRLSEHNRGHSKFTKKGMPWTLVYSIELESLEAARKEERRIKKKKSRNYIEYFSILF